MKKVKAEAYGLSEELFLSVAEKRSGIGVGAGFIAGYIQAADINGRDTFTCEIEKRVITEDRFVAFELIAVKWVEPVAANLAREIARTVITFADRHGQVPAVRRGSCKFVIRHGRSRNFCICFRGPSHQFTIIFILFFRGMFAGRNGDVTLWFCGRSIFSRAYEPYFNGQYFSCVEPYIFTCN